ncbi:MAG: 23S rRNA (adenine(2503)-C(2))-methyltransferase RlmN [Candidatus Zixiibacteriota bacterium]
MFSRISKDMNENKLNLKGLSLKELEEFLVRLGEKKYKSRQLFKWIYDKGLTDFKKMSDLSKSLIQKLEEKAYIQSIKKLKSLKSKDGSTEKFLYELEDMEKIESVLIKDGKRKTLCISTQVGCGLGCLFCATGRMGFKRNLTSGETIDQIISIKRHLDPDEKITNLVLMGMGEPLLNYDNTLKAIGIMKSELGLGFASRKITLSTAGIVPGIYRLADDRLKIKLAVSLNAASDDLRSHLMPVNKRYPLKELLGAAKYYAKKTDQRMTFEYLLMKNTNDSKKDALDLSKIVRGISCKINLIPYNRVPDLPFEKPDEESIKKFREMLYPRCPAVTLRMSKGEDIQAACGQLRIMSP